MPEYHIPVHDEGEDEDEQEDQDHGNNDDNDVPDEDADPSSSRSSNHFSPQETYETTSPRNSSTSNNVIIEAESSQESPPFPTRSSPASSPPLTQKTSVIGQSGEPTPATAPPNYTRLEIVPPLTDLNSANGDVSKQGNGDPSSPSTWEKMVNSFMRTNSGRRSRSNSIARREPLDGMINRESGNSLTMSRPDPSITVHQSLMQSPSASASMSSFSPYTPTRAAPSPIAPATSADMHKYQDAKLFPFPGIHMLEQRRVKGPSASASASASASVPDVANLHYSSNDDGPSHSFTASPSRTPEMIRERKLSHQASDTRLRGKSQYYS